MKKRITDIQREGKHSPRQVLFLDDERFGSVHPSLLTKFGLRIGLEIDEDVLQKLIDADEIMRARTRAFDLLLSQRYTREQMMDQLRQNGFSPPAIDATLENLEQLGYIRDEKYARNWVKSRRRTKPRGKKMLAHELINKGIDKTTVDRVIAQIDDDDDAASALQLAQKQAKRYRSLPPHVARRRLHGFLLRRGFDYEIIQRTIEHVLQGIDQS